MRHCLAIGGECLPRQRGGEGIGTCDFEVPGVTESDTFRESANTYDEVPLNVDDTAMTTQLVEGSKLAPHRHNIQIIDDMEAVGHTPLELLSERMIPWDNFIPQAEIRTVWAELDPLRTRMQTSYLQSHLPCREQLCLYQL